MQKNKKEKRAGFKPTTAKHRAALATGSILRTISGARGQLHSMAMCALIDLKRFKEESLTYEQNEALATLHTRIMHFVRELEYTEDQFRAAFGVKPRQALSDSIQEAIQLPDFADAREKGFYAMAAPKVELKLGALSSLLASRKKSSE